MTVKFKNDNDVIKRLIEVLRFKLNIPQEDAYDVALDAYVRMLEKQPTFETPQKRLNWLITVGVRLYIDQVRHAKRPWKSERAYTDYYWFYDGLKDYPLVIAHWYYDMPVKELAEQTGLTVGQLKRRLFIQAKELRKKL